MLEPLVYTVNDIKVLRKCGRDKAYAIARELPHFTDGKQIYVFKQDFDNDFEKIRNEALERFREEKKENNIYMLRKIR